jgi:hypothetical protein
MRIRSLLVIPASAAAVAALFASGAHAMGGACSSGQVLKSKSYVFALSIGPLEQMYTQAQVKAKHPKSGELMLSGAMSGGMSGMGMSASGQRHLEVHICNSAGAVVMGAHPTIVVNDPKAKTMTMSVPIATMEGVNAGASDYHYGNNVALTSGHQITVTVTLEGQKVVFHTVVSKAAMSMSG